MIVINHEKNSLVDDAEQSRKIDSEFLLRLKQLGDAGLRAVMDKLKGEKAD